MARDDMATTKENVVVSKAGVCGCNLPQAIQDERAMRSITVSRSIRHKSFVDERGKSR